MNRIFTQVDYSQFRQLMAAVATQKVKKKGFETVIYAADGDILAIVYAASIDEKGKCHPAQYHIKTSAFGYCLAQAA